MTQGMRQDAAFYKQEYSPTSIASCTIEHDWPFVKTTVLMSPQAVRWVAAGSGHMVAVTDSTVHSWGCNDRGQLGLGHFREQQQPAEILSLHGHKACPYSKHACV